MNSMVYTVHIDGTSRGNPGPAAWAYTITASDGTVTECGGHLGTATNNVAEYTALLQALDQLYQMGARQAVIHSDSELLVKQMNGQYQVKDAHLKQLYEQAKAKCQRLDSVQLLHVRREQNRRADELCNQTLGSRASKPASTAPTDSPTAAPTAAPTGQAPGQSAALPVSPTQSAPQAPGQSAALPVSPTQSAARSAATAKLPTKKAKRPRPDITADALECLRAAANAWARGNANDPPPEAVWEQLLSILHEDRSER
jgi:ribonuclease HI